MSDKVEIPDEAVLAAARSLQPTAANHEVGCPTYNLEPFVACRCAVKADTMSRARLALEAALPLLPASGGPAVDRQVIEELRLLREFRAAFGEMRIGDLGDGGPDASVAWADLVKVQDIDDQLDALVAALTEQPKEDEK